MADILGPLAKQDFLDSYWQRRPLLIRQALPDYCAPLSADELAGLALEAEVESRIVLEQGERGPWELRQGPFLEEDFRQLPATHWTLLVQALDLWIPEVANLLALFDFLPPWRLDDVMASYAAPGGSVGPHFDHYDVFLLQAEGQRQWQVGGQSAAPRQRLIRQQVFILPVGQSFQESDQSFDTVAVDGLALAKQAVADVRCDLWRAPGVAGFRVVSVRDDVLIVKLEHGAQFFEYAVVHVGAGHCHVAQCRHFEFARLQRVRYPQVLQ